MPFTPICVRLNGVPITIIYLRFDEWLIEGAGEPLVAEWGNGVLPPIDQWRNEFEALLNLLNSPSHLVNHRPVLLL
jgi:hypothetical protein